MTMQSSMVLALARMGCSMLPFPLIFSYKLLFVFLWIVQSGKRHAVVLTCEGVRLGGWFFKAQLRTPSRFVLRAVDAFDLFLGAVAWLVWLPVAAVASSVHLGAILASLELGGYADSPAARSAA